MIEELDPVVLEEWATNTIVSWREKMDKVRILGNDRLYNSFAYHVVKSAGGSISKVEFFFNWYGRMVDMGVGKGVKLNDVKEISIARRLEGRHSGNRRRPKKWYGGELERQTFRLSKLLQETYGKKSVAMIVENFEMINHQLKSNG